ncbi:MAG TPA: alpha/beta hydrolase [Aestuariivirgaceae bacterium]|nr:alpha/beta hydrolase [Aestuariivirgaceae bacterium]
MVQGLGYVHRFEPGAHPEAPLLLLLHGTGGNENDLVPLGRMIAPGAALLSPRGNVLENGMPRFFRRLAEGVFDLDDLRRRANELAEFVEAARDRYAIPRPFALGYSNGANIAAAILQLRPEILAGGVLLRAMLPLDQRPDEQAKSKSVLIVSGARDPIVPLDSARRLAGLLQSAGMIVEHRIVPAGHELSQADVELARSWLQPVTAYSA